MMSNSVLLLSLVALVVRVPTIATAFVHHRPPQSPSSNQCCPTPNTPTERLPFVGVAGRTASLLQMAAQPQEVTTKLIKELRDATGAGMMDCKKALVESQGDMEAASEYLRTKGLAKADKKAARVAAEGRISVATSGAKAVLVEINCETDFVAKDGSFLDFCNKVAEAAVKLESDDLEALLAAPMAESGSTTTVEEARQALVAKIGENIQVRRLASRGSDDKATSVVGAYVHMNRIGVLVEIDVGDDSGNNDKPTDVCTNVAMHVAALNPPFATADDVPSDVLEKERQILSAQALESGKPEEIVQKMVEGRIRKYLQEVCLVSQPFVKDDSKTVEQYIQSEGGKKAKMIGFTRIAVGEGIEKKADDFAEEVAKMAGTATKSS